MTSSHSCPQYSQLKAVTEIARVQPEHRFQVITGQFGKRRTTVQNRRFQSLFALPSPGLGRVARQN
jgi:hypothetical protein